MPENKNSNENSWDGVEKFLATEIINGEKREAKAFAIGMIVVAISLSGVVAGMIMANHSQTKMFYENDSQWRQTVEKTNQRWIDYLSDYDFITQDGEGINNINSGTQGDLINEPESPDQKEEKQGKRDSYKEK